MYYSWPTRSARRQRKNQPTLQAVGWIALLV